MRGSLVCAHIRNPLARCTTGELPMTDRLQANAPSSPPPDRASAAPPPRCSSPRAPRSSPPTSNADLLAGPRTARPPCLDVRDDASVAAGVHGTRGRTSSSTARASCTTAPPRTRPTTDWDFGFDLNVKSMFRTIRAALPVMLERRRRLHRQHVLGLLVGHRRAEPLRLRHHQGRRDRPDEIRRGRLRQARHPLQRDLPGHRRIAVLARPRQGARRADGQPAEGDGAVRLPPADGPRRDRGRDRGAGDLSRLRRERLHHRAIPISSTAAGPASDRPATAPEPAATPGGYAAPAGLGVGHVHLRVADLGPRGRFLPRRDGLRAPGADARRCVPRGRGLSPPHRPATSGRARAARRPAGAIPGSTTRPSSIRRSPT